MAETFGPILAKTRQERGESLEQIARVLHVKPHYLQALEEEDYAALPSDVQGKGFLRLYADHLGLPVQPLLEYWGKKPRRTPEDLKLITAAEKPPVTTETPPAEEDSQAETIEPPDIEPQPGIEPLPVASDSARLEETATSPKSGDLFVEIGQKFRQQREALDLTLEDVERHTHVRLHYLSAIEDGRIEDLPSPVQGRGMINNYASFLNLDADAILSTFAEALQTRRLETHVAPPASRKRGSPSRRAAAEPPSALRRLITPDLVLGGLLIAILFGFAVWSATRISAVEDQQAPPTPPSIAEVLLQTATPPVVTPTIPAALPGLATRIPDNNAANPTATEITPTITLPSAGSGALQVAIIAQMSTYMRVTVDGKVAFDGRAIVGNAYPFSGNNQIDLLTGNAAALQVFFNQTDLGNLGLVGQVKTLIFTKGSVTTPTPQATATSSPTPTFTVTPRSTQTLPAPTITPFIPNP